MALDAFCGAACAKGLDKVIEIIDDIRNYEKLVESLQDTELKELDARLSTIIQQVDDARDEQGLVIKDEVTLWIENSRDEHDDANKFLETTQKNAMNCFCHDCNCWKRYKHAQKAKSHAEEIGKLLSNSNFGEVYVSDLNPEPMAGFWSGEYVALPSMDATVEQLKSFLQVGGRDERLVVGIYGQVGVGKATVAKKLAADMESPELRVAIADGKSTEKIQIQIAERVGLKLKVESVTERAYRIFKKLERTKALIIFVNVDQTIVLSDIGVPRPQFDNHCRIMVTSTSSNVCKAMNSQATLEIKPLTLEESETFAAALANKYKWSNYSLADIPSGKAGLPSEILQLILTRTSPIIKLMTPRGSVAMGPWGGSGGDSFTFQVHTGYIKRITVCHGDGIIKRISFNDSNGREYGPFGLFGGPGVPAVIEIGDSQRLTSISGTFQHFVGMTLVTSLSFRINDIMNGPYGTLSGTPFSTPMQGSEVIGFFGRSGHYLDSIGLYVK